MINMVAGLKEYRERKAAEEARREEARKPRIQRFALEKDGDSAVVRIAQEMDFDAKNYDENLGIGFVNVEHTCGADPKNGWKNRANCSTESQGACLPCEKVSDYSVDWNDRKGWKQKEKFYINVIGGEPREVVKTENGKERKSYFTTDIDRKTGDGTVYLLEQSTHNGIYDSLADYFLEEEVSGGTITDKFFKISRKGSGFNDTSYSITPLKEIPADAKALTEFELVDIKEQALTEVPYAQQEAFYYKDVSVAQAAAPAAASAPAAAGSSDDTW
jgi:hypothetical protein